MADSSAGRQRNPGRLAITDHEPERRHTAGGAFGALVGRINADFRLAMVLSFGLFAVLVIAGFAVYRFGTGHLLGGVVNTTIVTGVTAVLVYALKTGHTDRAGVIFVFVAVIGCLASAALLGRTGFLWGYVVLWINFLLAHRHLALAMNLVMATGMIVINARLPEGAALLDSGLEVLTYAVTASMVTAYGYIFAARFQSQNRQLQALASMDPLTGAGNRRRMRRDLSAAAAKGAAPQSVLLADLDHFKQVNDHLGHEAGDRILKSFAMETAQWLDGKGSLYRFGGEEFVVHLPGRDAEAAATAGRELQARLAERIRAHEGPLRFSAGVAEYQPGEDWTDWVVRADLALYRAKNSGRNRVEISRSCETGGADS